MTNAARSLANGRFKKGKSGNPRGRPKKVTEPTSAALAFELLDNRTLTVTQNGEPQVLTVQEALDQKTYQQAIDGNRLAQKAVLRMIAKRDLLRASSKPKLSPGVKVLIEPNDPSNADEALQILDIASRDERSDYPAGKRTRLRLEPWAAQAALTRRRGKTRLTEENVSIVKLCTRDADKLNWPRGYKS